MLVFIRGGAGTRALRSKGTSVDRKIAGDGYRAPALDEAGFACTSRFLCAFFRFKWCRFR